MAGACNTTIGIENRARALTQFIRVRYSTWKPHTSDRDRSDYDYSYAALHLHTGTRPTACMLAMPSTAAYRLLVFYYFHRRIYVSHYYCYWLHAGTRKGEIKNANAHQLQYAMHQMDLKAHSSRYGRGSDRCLDCGSMEYGQLCRICSTPTLFSFRTFSMPNRE